MKAKEASLLQFLKNAPRFVIPIYQRTYSWTEQECAQLWADIIRVGNNDAVNAHFVGSVVYIESGLYQISSDSPLMVIDGQQRLTTVSLILEALARALGDGEPVEGFSAAKVRSYYLSNPLESGDNAFKLLLTQTDRDTLKALVDQRPLPTEQSLRIVQNFDFFRAKLEKLNGDLASLCRGLSKLVIVDVSLHRGQDNPQMIFESMNSTGRELSQADLIRNFVLMDLEPGLQTKIYEDYWRPMEVGFGQEGYSWYFDSFMRHYLTVKTGEIPNVRGVYDAFKAYSRLPTVAERGISELVKELRAFSVYFCAMALGQENNQSLANAFNDLRELGVDVAYPLLLEMYDDFANETLSAADFEASVRLIEAYVFRRTVCAIPTNSLNKTFATVGRSIDKTDPVKSFEAALELLPSYRRFPTDDEFKREFVVRDMYHLARRSYWLRRLENYGRKERVIVDDYTIEHIMPQNPELSKEWRTDLGDDWALVQEAKLHTAGNLTLTGYNSEYSDHPFVVKRDMEGGFSKSPLHLNEGLGEIERWNEVEIDRRASSLATRAAKVWRRPHLTTAVLDEYRVAASESPQATTVEHYSHLQNDSPMRSLFEELRTAILGMDPNIVEEPLKKYVAYKAETNVVDVVPQHKRLRLILNMPFPELQDSRGVAKDVTLLGRWGNGDVEVGLDRSDDIPYVIGLVRQSLDRQLGSST